MNDVLALIAMKRYVFELNIVSDKVFEKRNIYKTIFSKIKNNIQPLSI